MRKTVLIALLLILLPAGRLSAQFATGQQGGGTQSSGSTSDSTYTSYTLKRYFSSLSHRDSMSIGWMLGGSVILPGTAQIYNKDYWKLPIYYGGLAAAGYFWYYNDLQYKRFQKNYREATSPDGNYEGNLSVDNLQYYRDYYRRYRDYSIVATVAIYLLQVIDADVFATMSEFDVNQNISMNVEPAVIEPLNYEFTTNYASAVPAGSAVGIQMKFKF